MLLNINFVDIAGVSVVDLLILLILYFLGMGVTDVLAVGSIARALISDRGGRRRDAFMDVFTGV